MSLHDMAALFRRHRDGLLRFLRLRGARPATVEDLAQDAFIRLLQADRRREVEDARAYLFRIAANLAVDEARLAAVRHAGELSDREWAELADPAPSQERVAIARQELLRLAAAIRALSPRCRSVLLMVRFEGLTYREVGLRLGISTQTAHGYMVEALMKLHRHLDEKGP